MSLLNRCWSTNIQNHSHSKYTMLQLHPQPDQLTPLMECEGWPTTSAKIPTREVDWKGRDKVQEAKLPYSSSASRSPLWEHSDDSGWKNNHNTNSHCFSFLSPSSFSTYCIRTLWGNCSKLSPSRYRLYFYHLGNITEALMGKKSYM